jgi:hypothetical protein
LFALIFENYILNFKRSPQSVCGRLVIRRGWRYTIARGSSTNAAATLVAAHARHAQVERVWQSHDFGNADNGPAGDTWSVNSPVSAADLMLARTPAGLDFSFYFAAWSTRPLPFSLALYVIVYAACASQILKCVRRPIKTISGRCLPVR